MASAQQYVALIPGYNRIQPQFNAVVAGICTAYAGITNFCQQLLTAFDVDTAVGNQLDIIGLWVGVSRYISVPITNVFFTWDSSTLGWDQSVWKGPYDSSTNLVELDDYHYRFLLYARIAANHWNGLAGTALAAYNLAFTNQNVTITVIDNFNMTITVTVQGSTTALQQALLTGGYIKLTPLGCTTTYVFTG
jgi:hypothetical protein